MLNNTYDDAQEQQLAKLLGKEISRLKPEVKDIIIAALKRIRERKASVLANEFDA